MDYMSFGIGIFLGVGLAAAVGFRVFLPLLILSLGSYFDYIPINESWEWIGSLTAVITLAIATLVEVFGYYIPWADNILDTIAIPLATLAGTLVMMAVVSDLDPVISWALAIIAGGGTAAAIKGSSAAVRLGSSTTTAGLGNPVIATVETGAATLMSLVSVLIPVVAFILVLFIFFGIIRFYKKLRKKQRPSV